MALPQLKHFLVSVTGIENDLKNQSTGSCQDHCPEVEVTVAQQPHQGTNPEMRRYHFRGSFFVSFLDKQKRIENNPFASQPGGYVLVTPLLFNL